MSNKRYHADLNASAAFYLHVYFGADMKPNRDTRARNLVFLVAVVSAIVVGFWLAR
ncbi:hypothetical protein [Halovibrio variabilis]|uniref:hypothetical protein n=1 Tax=Halovibrio variabilis TaxID=31910 RepID=UPI001478278B|nr:hypothetical protein [Halovibrio variabilis]